MEPTEKPVSRFITAQEVARDSHISMGQAYKVVRKINDTLTAQGYIIPRHGQTLRRMYFKMTGGE
ncbi:hypothetical protein [Mitsuokella sp.]|uniref:hypothetical protein n=1 Tax=Mitsuokella sp. TaxID=2049034 RepID=UPI003D7D1F58